MHRLQTALRSGSAFVNIDGLYPSVGVASIFRVSARTGGCMETPASSVGVLTDTLLLKVVYLRFNNVVSLLRAASL